MIKPMIGTAVAALLVGLLAGYLYWGAQTGQLRGELAQARRELIDVKAKMDQTVSTLSASAKEVERKLQEEQRAREALERKLAGRLK